MDSPRFLVASIAAAGILVVLLGCPLPQGLTSDDQASQEQTPIADAAFPATPEDLAVFETPTVSAVVLTWSSVGGATGYRIYRSSSQNGVYVLIGTDITPAATTSYTDTLLAPGTTYWYKVCSFDARGEGATSVAVQATTAEVVPVPVSALSDSSTTWSTGNVYWVKNTIYLSSGKALVLEQGAVIKFAASAQLVVEAGGQLTATGSAVAPIIFTSQRDDSIGGDTDGVALTPSASDWSGAAVAGDHSAFEYCEFRYAQTGLTVTASNVTVNRCTFRNNSTGLDADAVGTGFSVANSSFFSNTYPLVIGGSYNVDDTLSFEDPSEPSLTNEYQAIRMVANNLSISANVTWSNTKVPYVYDKSGVNSTIFVPSPYTLTLAPGVALKFAADGALSVNAGASVSCVGSATHPIVFTSYYDASALGDSAGGSPTTPAPGSWNGVTVAGDSSAFDYCDFRYAATGLVVTASNVPVIHCTFRNNTTGLDADAVGSGFSVANSDFYANHYPLVIGGSYNVDDTLTFHDPADSSVKNDYQAVRIVADNLAITGNVTWSNTKVPYVYDKTGINSTIFVLPPYTLTLAPGVAVKFGASGALSVSAGACLSCLGSATHPVIFTSYYDATAICESAGGSPTLPAAGNWNGIIVAGDSSAFDYCEFRYAQTGLTVTAASVSLSHSTFRNSITGLDADGVGSSFALASSSFYANTYPIVIGGRYDVDNTLSFQDPSNPSQKNIYQSIRMVASNLPISGHVRWSNTQVPYVYDKTGLNSTIYVNSGCTLELASGVAVKFSPSGGLTVNLGGALVGSDNAVFTSYRDDSVLGDSNGDGIATSPADGDWNGLAIGGTWLTGDNVRYDSH